MIPSLIALAFMTSSDGIARSWPVVQGRLQLAAVQADARAEAGLLRDIREQRELLQFFREHNIDQKLVDKLELMNKTTEAKLVELRARRALPPVPPPYLTREQSMERLRQAVNEGQAATERVRAFIDRMRSTPPPTPGGTE